MVEGRREYSSWMLYYMYYVLPTSGAAGATVCTQGRSAKKGKVPAWFKLWPASLAPDSFRVGEHSLPPRSGCYSALLESWPAGGAVRVGGSSAVSIVLCAVESE